MSNNHALFQRGHLNLHVAVRPQRRDQGHFAVAAAIFFLEGRAGDGRDVILAPAMTLHDGEFACQGTLFRRNYKELWELDAPPGNIHIMSDSFNGAGKGDFAKWLIMTIASRAPVR